MSAPPGQRFIPGMIVYRILGQPSVDLDAYRLRIDGEVERPLELTYADLTSLPSVKLVWDFHCVTGWSVKAVEWEGVELKRLAELVRPAEGAMWIYAEGLDKYSAIVHAEDALSGGIVALKMNGKTLLPEHGFPVRLVFRDLYGWKGVKYLTRLSFLREYVDGYWEKLGYSERGRVFLEERFKT